jgi:polyferredoxin
MMSLHRTIRLIGLGLLLTGLIAFNSVSFLASYQLTPEIIKTQVPDSARATLLQQVSKNLLTNGRLSLWSFVSGVKESLTSVNDTQVLKYGMDDNALNSLSLATKDHYTQAKIDSLFAGNDAVSTFRRKAMKDFGNWLDGKPATREQLQQVAGNIRQYAIIPQLGFDKYAIRDLTYGLTRASLISPVTLYPLLYLVLTVGLCVIGAMLFILPSLANPTTAIYQGTWKHVMKSGQWLGIATGAWLIGFYVVLYFYPEYMVSWIAMTDPVSLALNGHEAGRFFLYGFLYTICILVMGIRMMIRYRDNRYQLARTASVMFFQTAFAFLIPEVLIRLNQPYFDFKNIWPLDYSFFFDNHLDALIQHGGLGVFMLVWGIMLMVVAVPVLVYLFGKRWYCSWVCGCGGLAETLGDPYRQLSDKRLVAWRIERWTIHSVLVFAVVMTIGVLYTYFTGASWFLFFDTYQLREVYGAFIGAGFAGVVGTGFYPKMGNRVWCRFGCPLAAYLGLVQRFSSRFRITTNGGQCISCGNCSTYCEMGIDVRWYAQRGQNIVRSSCVGCGVCSSVCPRGVLNLEVKNGKGRMGSAVLAGNDSSIPTA